jgi:hypothetical protein
MFIKSRSVPQTTVILLKLTPTVYLPGSDFRLRFSKTSPSSIVVICRQQTSFGCGQTQTGSLDIYTYP